MNAPLRRAGVVVMVLFGLLFVNLNWVQAYKADDYRNSDYNRRVQLAEYERQRGVIQTLGGKVLATSKETDDELRFLRTYPAGEAYTPVVGYKPVNLAETGIERAENDYLAGTSDQLFADRIRDMFTGKETSGGNVILTLSARAQETAFKELQDNRVGARKGAAVALDPTSGAVQALVSMPSFDANPLTSHDTDAAQAAYDKLNADKDKPLLNRAVSETYPPGSTFKVIDSAAALENGLEPDSVVQGGSSYLPPQAGQPIHNAPGVVCPSTLTLKQALTVSCNTAFSRLCVDKLNADKIKSEARQFGFEEDDLSVGRLDGEGIPVAASHTGDMLRPDGQQDPALLAQSCIGQSDVRMTPLQGALIAATVANNGRQMRPYLVQQLKGPDLTTVHYTAQPRPQQQPISEDTAGKLRDMMESVVRNGTGRRAQISGYTVGGKTGTAENGDNPDHGWFIGFVLKDGKPITAVCVFLEHAGSGGSSEAARIAGQVMRAVIADRGGD
ncbi:MAG: penicillin-binding protein 2 [Micromonosporaceae bacterium]|jgi:peptidoglycan glycosyltransferase|nr:penicillin-binding protein 2 [Micromonosporaceae bacterium]